MDIDKCDKEIIIIIDILLEYKENNETPLDTFERIICEYETLKKIANILESRQTEKIENSWDW